MENLVDLDGKAQDTMDSYAKMLKRFGERAGTDSEEVFGHIKVSMSEALQSIVVRGSRSLAVAPNSSQLVDLSCLCTDQSQK